MIKQRCGLSKRIYLILIQLLLICRISYSGSVEISWTPNTEPDLSGYRVHYGTASRQYSNTIDVGNDVKHVISNLTDNIEYFFAVTAYDTADNESAYSPEVSCILGDTQAPTLVNARILDETTVEVEFSEKVDRFSATTSGNYTIDHGIQVTGINLLNDGKRVQLSTTKHIPGQTYTLMVKGVQDIARPVNTIAENSTITYNYEGGANDNTGPTLTLINITKPAEVEVFFNEKIDRPGAEAVANYRINNGIQVAAATLDPSGNKVKLSTSLHSTGIVYTLTVSGIKDVAGNPINDNSTITYQYTPADTVGPTIELVNAIDATHVDVLFNEQVEMNSAERISNYSLSGGVTVLSARLNESRNLVHLETTPHSNGQLYIITITGVRDNSPQANLITPGSQYSYTFVAEDTVGPALVRVDVMDRFNLELIFNEELDLTSAETTGNYQVSDGVQVQSASLDVPGKKVKLVTTEHQAGHLYTLTLNGIKDASANGNEILANTTYRYNIPGGNPALTIVQVDINSSTSISVSFNLELDRNTVETAGNYRINHGVQILTARLAANKTTVELTTSVHTEGLSYILTVSGLKSTTGAEITPNTTYMYVYEPTDNIGPTISMVKMTDATHVDILFSEYIDKTSGEVLLNYKISGEISVLKASVDGTGKVVKLETSAHQENKLYILTVNGVTDATQKKNKILTNSQYSYVFEPEDHAGPLISRVTIIDDRHLDVVFNERLEKNSAEVKENYKINNNVSIINAILNINGYVVHLETTEHNANKAYTLTVTGVKDLAPSANEIQPNSSYTYVYNPGAGAVPSIVDVIINSETSITVVFNKAMEVTSAENIANYRINNGIQVLSAQLQSSSNEVKLTTTRHEEGKLYIVMVSNVAEAQPPAATVLPNTPFVYLYYGSKGSAPTIISINILEKTLVQVTFDKELDQLSAENHYHYSITNSVNVLSAELDRTRRIVFLTTGRHRIGQAYALTVTGVRDLQGNEIEEGNTGAYAFFPELDITMVSNTEIEMSFLQLNRPYYVDRNYVITGFPAGFERTRMIKTRNDDKDNTSQTFLTFRVTQEALIYVAYDSRASSFPKWLEQNFTRTQMYLGVSDKAERLDLWVAEAHPGEIRLGGNNAAIAQNVNSMYVVLIVERPGNYKGPNDNPLDDDDDRNIDGLPRKVELVQNYPNPFNPETRIMFQVPMDQEVSLVVYNILGQKVRTLFEGIASAGAHTAIWNGTNEDGHIVSAGTYFYKLEAWNTVERGGGTFVENYALVIKKMVFLK